MKRRHDRNNNGYDAIGLIVFSLLWSLVQALGMVGSTSPIYMIVKHHLPDLRDPCWCSWASSRDCWTQQLRPRSARRLIHKTGYDHLILAADPVSLLADLIRCASVTPTEAGVLDVFERAGAARVYRDAAPLRGRRRELSRRQSVRDAGGAESSDGPHLLFSGHTDVVPPGDRALWTHDPFGAEIVDDVMSWARRGRHEVRRRGVRCGSGAAARAWPYLHRYHQ